MPDQDFIPEYLEQIKNNLQACRDWLHQTLEQPYTVAEMTSTLEYYLNEHLRYYSNKPGQVPEKQQRIFKIDDRLKGDLFRRTHDFHVALAPTVDKAGMIRAEIARYEHPYLYHMEGIYFRPNAISIVIPHVIDTLSESHSPYFEYFFDGDLNPKYPGYFDFFSDVYFLEFLRRELIQIVEQGKRKKKQSHLSPQYASFESVFKAPADFQKVVEYLKSINILDEIGEYIEASGNKKYLAVLIQVLRQKSKIIPILDNEAARLMKDQFKVQSLSSDYLSKDFPNREALIEEMMKDLRL